LILTTSNYRGLSRNGEKISPISRENWWGIHGVPWAGYGHPSPMTPRGIVVALNQEVAVDSKYPIRDFIFCMCNELFKHFFKAFLFSKPQELTLPLAGLEVHRLFLLLLLLWLLLLLLLLSLLLLLLATCCCCLLLVACCLLLVGARAKT